MGRRFSRMGLMVVLGLTACSSSLVSEGPANGTVPEAAGPADTACLDTAGILRAGPTAWYHDDALGVVVLNGDLPAHLSDHMGPFAEAASAAAAEQLGPMPAVGIREFTTGGCVSYRSAGYTLPNGTLNVAAWRMERAAQPGWIPNEGPFVPDGDDVLVSTGPHLVVALAVAVDGTTVRVAAYGVGEVNVVSGWPTTMPQPLGAPPPGPAPATADQVVAIARAMLPQVVDR